MSHLSYPHPDRELQPPDDANDHERDGKEDIYDPFVSLHVHSPSVGLSHQRFTISQMRFANSINFSIGVSSWVVIRVALV